MSRLIATPSATFLAALVLATLSCRTADVEALELRKSNSQICAHEIAGPIEQGDFKKVSTALPPDLLLNIYGRDASNSRDLTVCLDSPGGSYTEGIKIGQYFLEGGIGTAVDKQAECVSACALIFMSGAKCVSMEPTIPCGQVWYTSRKMHKDARIGFHAPYLDLGSDRQFSATEVNVAYTAALGAVTQLADLGRNRGGRDVIIPMGLIVELLRRGPNEIFYIDTVDKAGRWNIDLFGFSLTPELTRMNGARACHNLLWWNDDKSATLPAERLINVTTLDEYIISEWGWGWGGVELSWVIVHWGRGILPANWCMFRTTAAASSRSWCVRLQCSIEIPLLIRI